MPKSPISQNAGVADDAIAALKPGFLESLKTQCAELKLHRKRVAEGDIDDNARQAMRFTVHALRGTAASYFFPEIPETAAPLERAIVAGDTLGDLSFLTLLDKLLGLCAAALEEETA